MCDTLVVVRPTEILFAKNSDRPRGEAQVLTWEPARRWPPGSRLRCTWTTVPQARVTLATVLSRPIWMWGAEMGANEAGVVVGNEALLTWRRPPRHGLTGMDLVRLALERARTAFEAVDVILDLAHRFGQGGGCTRGGALRYYSSFAIADPNRALLLETSAAGHHLEPIDGVISLSNRARAAPWAQRRTDPIRTAFVRARRREQRAAAGLTHVRGELDLFRLLRDHGRDGDIGHPARPRVSDFGGLCMHGRGLVVPTQTAASWVSRLAGGRLHHWATATPVPCTGLFKPIEIDRPIPFGRPADRPDSTSLWWRHEKLRHLLHRAPPRLRSLYRNERDELEASWIETRPASTDAFDAGADRLATWTDRLLSRGR